MRRRAGRLRGAAARGAVVGGRRQGPDPLHEIALTRLGQEPILGLGTGLGDGLAGLLALPVLRAAARGVRLGSAGGRQRRGATRADNSGAVEFGARRERGGHLGCPGRGGLDVAAARRRGRAVRPHAGLPARRAGRVLVHPRAVPDRGAASARAVLQKVPGPNRSRRRWRCSSASRRSSASAGSSAGRSRPLRRTRRSGHQVRRTRPGTGCRPGRCISSRPIWTSSTKNITNTIKQHQSALISGAIATCARWPRRSARCCSSCCRRSSCSATARRSGAGRCGCSRGRPTSGWTSPDEPAGARWAATCAGR